VDPETLLLHDIAHSKVEDRYIAIAKSARRRILTIVFTLRSVKNGEKIFRIISARVLAFFGFRKSTSSPSTKIETS